jgi:endonuclease III-like uncharacterized protein
MLGVSFNLDPRVGGYNVLKPHLERMYATHNYLEDFVEEAATIIYNHNSKRQAQPFDINNFKESERTEAIRTAHYYSMKVKNQELKAIQDNINTHIDSLFFKVSSKKINNLKRADWSVEIESSI